jgi:5,6-dimethylbenzimidazole synthase
MKTATFPSVRVEPELREAAENVLLAGESLSELIEQAIRENIQRRRIQSEFIARGLASRDAARRDQAYVRADDVIKDLRQEFPHTRSISSHPMQNCPPQRFSDDELAAVYRAIRERRDMRHFNDQPIPAELLSRLFDAAHCAPSVGYMQPWRFVRVSDAKIRTSLHDIVEAERQATAQALGERGDEFMRLKVQGILDCAEVIVVGLMENREGHVFGRRTLPEMDLASVSCAIQNMWLAARAEGVGMGWVSLFEVAAIQRLLQMPADARPIAILCLGYVDQFYDEPMLQTEGWRSRRSLPHCVEQNRWPSPEGT